MLIRPKYYLTDTYSLLCNVSTNSGSKYVELYAIQFISLRKFILPLFRSNFTTVEFQSIIADYNSKTFAVKYLRIIPHFWKLPFFTFHQNREYCFIFNEFFLLIALGTFFYYFDKLNTSYTLLTSNILLFEIFNIHKMLFTFLWISSFLTVSNTLLLLSSSSSLMH